jgi:hypothetical protein
MLMAGRLPKSDLPQRDQMAALGSAPAAHQRCPYCFPGPLGAGASNATARVAAGKRAKLGLVLIIGNEKPFIDVRPVSKSKNGGNSDSYNEGRISKIRR